jgi:hypothetical protein
MSAINKLLSKRKKKKTNDLTPTGSAANNGTDVSENKRHDKILMYLDPVIEMVNITKEAAELLPPLKLACGVTIRILTIVRVRRQVVTAARLTNRWFAREWSRMTQIGTSWSSDWSHTQNILLVNTAKSRKHSK